MRKDVKCEITEETHNLVLTEKRVFDLPCINSGERDILWYNRPKEKNPLLLLSKLYLYKILNALNSDCSKNFDYKWEMKHFTSLSLIFLHVGREFFIFSFWYSGSRNRMGLTSIITCLQKFSLSSTRYKKIIFLPTRLSAWKVRPDYSPRKCNNPLSTMVIFFLLVNLL